MHATARLALSISLFAAPIGILMPQAHAVVIEEETEEKFTKDVLIFKDGKTIEGQIVEETATKIIIKINVGGLEATTTYQKSDILEIEYDVASDETPDAKAEVADDRTDDFIVTDIDADADPDAARIYYVKLRGIMGRDITQTPMARMVEDAKKYQPDYIFFEVDCEFSDFMQRGREAFQDEFRQFDTAYDLVPIVTDEIRDDPTWKKKPELVFWVKRALGAPAFFVLCSEHIYYHPDGEHGGIGYLDKMLDGQGDLVVREKMRSLLLARAEGMAARGGHPAEIVRAMCRSDYWLSYDYVGGEPIFREYSYDGEHLLTDDGIEERMDTMQDVIRGRGNDVLRLEPDTALRLGISHGTCRDMKAVLDRLGVARNYVQINAADRIFADWSKNVGKAERNVGKLFRDANGAMEDMGQAQDRRERKRARGRLINIYKEIRVVIRKYGEAINPRNLQGLQAMPGQIDQYLDREIARLETIQFLDR